MQQTNTSRSEKKTQYIFIEYCCNCANHAWNTKHDEGKYSYHFDKLKENIEQQIKGTIVLGNTIIEPHLPRMEGGMRVKPQLLMRKIEPQLGAFEIIYRNKIIFSKLSSRVWPSFKKIVERLKSIINSRDPNDSFTDYGSTMGEDIQNMSFEYNTMRKMIGPAVKTPGRAHSEVRRRPQFSSRETESIDSRGSVSPHKQKPQQPNVGPLYQKYQPVQNIAELKPIIDKTAQFVPVKRFIKNGIWQKDHPTRPGAVIYESSLESRDFAENLAEDKKISYQEKNGRIEWNQLPSLTESKVRQRFEDSKYEGEPIDSKNQSFFLTADEDPNKSFQNGRSKFDPEQQDHHPSEPQSRKQNVRKSNSSAFKNKENGYDEYQHETFEQYSDEGENGSKIGRASFEKPRPPDKKPSDSQFNRGTPRKTPLQMNQRQLDPNESSSTIEGKAQMNKVLDKSDSVSENQRYSKVTNQNQDTPVSPQKFIQEIALHSYPEEKTSMLNVPLGQTSRKKITLKLKEGEISSLRIYASEPTLIALKDPKIEVNGQESIKIPLRIQAPEDGQNMKYFIYILKDDKPWQKITITAKFS